MNIDEVGEFLEHHGLTDDEIDAYFEHHGVKGQQWGVRKRTLAKIGGGVVAGVVAARFVGKRTLNTKAILIAGTAAAVVGAKETGKLLDKHGSMSIQDIPQQG